MSRTDAPTGLHVTRCPPSPADTWHRYRALYGGAYTWAEPTPEEIADYHAERARIAREYPNHAGPTRSGVVVVFFLLWCAAMFGGTLLGLRTPRTVEQVEHRWHGPAHQYPQEYAR